MTRLIIVAVAAIGLILLVAYFITRLVRSRRRGMSIRLQVFVALAAVIGAFAFGLGLLVLDRIDARATRFATHNATDKANVIAKLLGGEMELYDKSLKEIARAMPQRAPPHLVEGVLLYDASGELLYRSPRGLPEAKLRTVSVEAPIIKHNRTLGKIRVVKTTLAIEKLLKDFAPTVLVISLVLGAAAALAAVWIGHTIAGPIEALSEFAQRVSQGQLRLAVPASQGREVSHLVRSIDSMRRQLEGRPFVEAFAADLSHELKNPVAAIRAAAEVLDDSALEEPEQARLFVRRIRESTDRIERLLGDLLSLARIEARGVEEFEAIELSSVLRTTVQALDTTRIRLGRIDKLRVRGEPNWLARAITNLLDNALLHAEGDAFVSLTQEGREAVLRVKNAGAINKHAQDRIFKRFVTTRADKGGSGLGLAIVRAVAEAHRGRVQLAESGPPEVVFRLALPLA